MSFRGGMARSCTGNERRTAFDRPTGPVPFRPSDGRVPRSRSIMARRPRSRRITIKPRESAMTAILPIQESRSQRFAMRCSNWAGRWFPDSWVFTPPGHPHRQPGARWPWAPDRPPRRSLRRRFLSLIRSPCRWPSWSSAAMWWPGSGPASVSSTCSRGCRRMAARRSAGGAGVDARLAAQLGPQPGLRRPAGTRPGAPQRTAHGLPRRRRRGLPRAGRGVGAGPVVVGRAVAWPTRPACHRRSWRSPG